MSKDEREMITRTIAEGEAIYTPFSTRREVFIIQLGYVLAYTYDDYAKRRIHLIYGPGAYFPVLTTFNGGEQRATYEALTRTLLHVFTRSDFLQELARNPSFCRTVLDKTVNQLSIFADRVIDLQTTKLEDKLLHRLKVLAKEHGTRDARGMSLPYKLKHHHLADMLGVERESVTRTLQVLKKKGQISKNSEGCITILE